MAVSTQPINTVASLSVRTALVFRPMVQKLLEHFNGKPHHQAAILLAARGGLRLSDMEALRLGDIEAQPNGMLLIHPTLWGDLKTSSARRVLPFEHLLNPEEQLVWRNFLKGRRAEDLSQHALARALAPFGLRPHDLRHGALSNLALLLLAPEPCAPLILRLTDWSKTGIERLHAILVVNDPWRGTKALARLAGHYDPATTFESYIHISDLALGLHVQAASPQEEADKLLRRLGLSRRSLGKRVKTTSAERLRAKVVKRLAVQDISSIQKSTPETIYPPAKEMTVSLYLQIEEVFLRGRNNLDIAKTFAVPLRVVNKWADLPRLKRLRSKADRKRLSELSEQLLHHPQARIWALQVQKAPMRGIIFHAPFAAELWFAILSKKLRCEAELHSHRPDRWGKWAKGRVFQPSGAERLILKPIAADGRKGMELVKQVARITLAVLEAQEAMLDQNKKA